MQQAEAVLDARGEASAPASSKSPGSSVWAGVGLGQVRAFRFLMLRGFLFRGVAMNPNCSGPLIAMFNSRSGASGIDSLIG